MLDDDDFPVVIHQQPVTNEDEPVNRLINSIAELPQTIEYVVIATKVQV